MVPKRGDQSQEEGFEGVLMAANESENQRHDLKEARNRKKNCAGCTLFPRDLGKARGGRQIHQ